MSAQIDDLFLWEGEEWVFFYAKKNNIKNPNALDYFMAKLELFDPDKYNLDFKSFRTDCMEGYVTQFSIKENKLFFEKLWISCRDNIYPKINGVEAKYIQDKNDFFYGFHFYENISKRLYYTGIIKLGQKCDREYLGHYLYTYNRVCNLTFENGVLKDFYFKVKN